MITAAATRQAMGDHDRQWLIPLMDFVDDFRYHRDPRAVEQPFAPGQARLDALLAAVIEFLCREMGLTVPPWVEKVPPAPQAWFVSGLQSLMAIALVESPLPFRIRRIFVLDNFLSRA